MKKMSTAKYWIKECFFFVFIIMVFSVGMDLWRKQDMPISNAPPISGETLSGEEINVIEMSKEKPVIVYFWATWCSACKVVTPTINWFSDMYQVVGIPIVSGDNKRVSAYLNAHEYDFININDPKGKISKEWGITVTPSILIINNGEVASVTTGVTTPWGLLGRLWLTTIMNSGQ